MTPISREAINVALRSIRKPIDDHTLASKPESERNRAASTATKYHLYAHPQISWTFDKMKVVVVARLVHGMTYAEIGRELNLSVARISQIYKKTLRHFRLPGRQLELVEFFASHGISNPYSEAPREGCSYVEMIFGRRKTTSDAKQPDLTVNLSSAA